MNTKRIVFVVIVAFLLLFAFSALVLAEGSELKTEISKRWLMIPEREAAIGLRSVGRFLWTEYGGVTATTATIDMVIARRQNAERCV